MEIPKEIHWYATRLKAGHRVNRMTVREFLQIFGAERRGSGKVFQIRSALDTLDLKTDPDFETSWIDEPIWIRLKEGDSASPGNGSEAIASSGLTKLDADDDERPASIAVQQVEERASTAPRSEQPEAVDDQNTHHTSVEDPTFRIGNLEEAHRDLITVNQGDPLNRATTLMMRYDYSQLPVMQGARDIKGMITWKSIGCRKAFDRDCKRVGDCLEEPQIVEAKRILFDVIPIIMEHGYVLVREQDRTITGIVTASDLSMQLRARSEPFLLLRETELHLRRLLADKLSAEDLASLGAGPNPRPARAIERLSFGEYARLCQHPTIWEKLDLKLDKEEFTHLLEDVRTIRNDVVHFDPDPMTPDQLRTLKQAASLMRDLAGLHPQIATQANRDNRVSLN